MSIRLPIQVGERQRYVLSTIRLFILAIVVGILVGAAADGFRWLLPHTNQLFFGTFHASEYGVASMSYVLQRPYIIVFPAVGGLFVGLFLYFFKDARGHGVAEVLAAMETRGNRIAPQVSAYTAIASSVTIGSGGSAGPEGPAIQIGAALGSGIGQWFGMPLDELRTLLACGAATGLAALYNAPLGGTFFAIEVLLEEIRPQRFALIALSAVAGHYVATHLIVNQSLVDARFQQVSWQSIPLDLVLGLLAAPLGVGFLLLLHRIAEFASETHVWPWVRPAIGGLLVGLVGLFFPRVLGTGEDTIRQAILGSLPLALLLIFPLLKLAATAITLGSGGSGGVFTPSLFMGATLGAAYGAVVHAVFPGVGAPGAFAMIGMGTVIASAVNAPLTAILIVVELTGDFQLLPGLVTAVAGSVLLARYLYPESIYTLPLVLRGIQRAPLTRNPLAGVFVRQAVRTNWPTVRPATSVQEILATGQTNREAVLPVVDEGGCLRGLIQMSDVAQAVGRQGSAGLRGCAEEFMTAATVTARPNETLHDVLRRLGAAEMQIIPVLGREDCYLGVLERAAMLRIYSQQATAKET
jgi:CIC family chloride channel protein